MFHYNPHNRWAQLVLTFLGATISAVGVNTFIVPQGFYSGGLLGVCQLLRTLIFVPMGLVPQGFDIAGILYFVLNIPILLFTGRSLGKSFVIRTAFCASLYSVLYSVIPVPTTPVVEDMLTSALLAGILSGVGGGIVLTCGNSGGGLDAVGLYLSKKGKGFTVGRFSIGFNCVLYAVCFFLFVPEIVIYSVIFNFFTAMVLDRMHQQNIIVEVLIFTQEDKPELPRFIMEKLGRGVTYWTGYGGYTGRELKVLCVCLSKYEIEDLRRAVHEIDPKAFFITKPGVTVDGKFVRKLEG